MPVNELLVPYPQHVAWLGHAVAKPASVDMVLDESDSVCRRDADRLADDLLRVAGIDARGGDGSRMRLRLAVDPTDLRPEGYRLRIDQDGMVVTGADATGLFYGQQTLLQLLAYSAGNTVDVVDIVDWPTFGVREWMLDMGRAPFSIPLLQRCVRIMARLKLNTLHLHLFDDHLNSLRYARLPLGSENPCAISIAELGQLVAYARQWHVRVVPELEAWGHGGSILHHYPDLYGGPGMWEGYSFGIGEALYDLFAKMFDEVVPVLEDDCDMHLGLDEAIWAVLPSVPDNRKDDYSPERHVGRLYDLLQAAGQRHRRHVRMRVWADHGGRPIPAAIAGKVVVEPWQYFAREAQEIRDKVARYGGAGKAPFMCGAGMSHAHMQGGYEATRVWCESAADAVNCEGVDICLWGTNNVADTLVGVYAGADFAWTPGTPTWTGGKEDTSGELLRWQVVRSMKRWQATFGDGDAVAIRADMGQEVYLGHYQTGTDSGQPVAPTCRLNAPRGSDTLTR